MGDFNVAMTPKDVHPSIPFEGLYGAQEMAIMQVGGGWGQGLAGAHGAYAQDSHISSGDPSEVEVLQPGRACGADFGTRHAWYLCTPPPCLGTSSGLRRRVA